MRGASIDGERRREGSQRRIGANAEAIRRKQLSIPRVPSKSFRRRVEIADHLVFEIDGESVLGRVDDALARAQQIFEPNQTFALENRDYRDVYDKRKAGEDDGEYGKI